MQDEKRTPKSKGSRSPLQVLNALRVRALQARGGFMATGATSYMGFLELQAVKEGRVLDAVEKTRLRQVMNAHLSIWDADRVDFIERALKSIPKAA